MRVLVTGVTGFVGPHLVRVLQDAGHEVAGTCHHEEAPGDQVETHPVDLEDREALRAVVAHARPDRIAHLAGLSHVGTSWRQMGAYFRVNVLGTENVLAAAGEVPVVLASSAEVYGPVPETEQPIGESRTLDPASPYALTKAAAERLVLAGQGTVARCFNLIGPGQSPQFALPSFARQLAAIEAGDAEAVLRVGNLEARRDFVAVEDGARALCLLLERGEPGTTYQVATGRSRSIRELLDRLIGLTGLRVAIEVDPERLRPVDVPRLEGQARRLRALGWTPSVTLDESLEALWQATRSVPQAG